MSANFLFDLTSCHVLVSSAEQSMQTPQHRLALLTRSLSTAPIRLAIGGAAEVDAVDAARKWHAEHGGNPVAADSIGHVTYARSSGPGGQNVNKVNSKAQLRVPLGQLLHRLPSILRPAIIKSRYVAPKTSSLLIQCDESRKQQDNRDTCYRRLNELIMQAYRDSVPGETSDEQKKKVKDLQKAENEARLRQKKIQSSKKAARGKGRGED